MDLRKHFSERCDPAYRSELGSGGCDHRRLRPAHRKERASAETLNGIAYDPVSEAFFLTGKFADGWELTASADTREDELEDAREAAQFVTDLERVEQGTDIFMNYARIDAEYARKFSAFGIDVDAVEVIHGDTDAVQFGMGSYGSRSAAVGVPPSAWRNCLLTSPSKSKWSLN